MGFPGSREQAVKQCIIVQASCFTDPVRAMESVLKTLAQANASQRVELDWEAQNQVHASHILASHLMCVDTAIRTWRGPKAELPSWAAIIRLQQTLRLDHAVYMTIQR